MAKTKTPFMSFGSSGTVGGVLTSQKRGRATILRETPRPTDPYSLKQAYQRWDYQDYAYLWTLLTNSEKQIYRTRASRYHITGFSQWMRERLKDLDGLVGRWYMDEKLGAVAYDSSKQGNNGTIIGATPTTGLIAGGFSFDGVNDTIYCGTNPILLPDIFTLEVRIKNDGSKASQGLVSWNAVGFIPLIELKKVGRLLVYWHPNNYRYFLNAPTDLYDDKWHTLHILSPGYGQYDIDNTLAYADGIQQTPTTPTHTNPPTVKQALHIGDVTHDLQGDLDHLALYDYLLPETLIKRHALRRYPA